MSEKIEQILTNFKDEAKKHKTFEKNFIVRLIKIIEKNKDSMTIVNNKFKFDTIFFSNFIKDIDKNKDDNYYYKNFNRLKKFNIIHKSSSYFPKNKKEYSYGQFIIEEGILYFSDNSIENADVIQEPSISNIYNSLNVQDIFVDEAIKVKKLS